MEEGEEEVDKGKEERKVLEYLVDPEGDHGDLVDRLVLVDEAAAEEGRRMDNNGDDADIGRRVIGRPPSASGRDLGKEKKKIKKKMRKKKMKKKKNENIILQRKSALH